jgi:hypothetical protein
MVRETREPRKTQQSAFREHLKEEVVGVLGPSEAGYDAYRRGNCPSPMPIGSSSIPNATAAFQILRRPFRIRSSGWRKSRVSRAASAGVLGRADESRVVIRTIAAVPRMSPPRIMAITVRRTRRHVPARDGRSETRRPIAMTSAAITTPNSPARRNRRDERSTCEDGQQPCRSPQIGRSVTGGPAYATSQSDTQHQERCECVWIIQCRVGSRQSRVLATSNRANSPSEVLDDGNDAHQADRDQATVDGQANPAVRTARPVEGGRQQPETPTHLRGRSGHPKGIERIGDVVHGREGQTQQKALGFDLQERESTGFSPSAQ